VGRAKDLRIEPIAGKDARRICRQLHYSGKVVANSQVHFGAFLGGKCGGVMQYGPPMDRKRSARLVDGTKPHQVIELNRMAFADWLPRNSESRAISVSLRMIRRTYPHLQWVLSFADACRCGDGTIYRASGFVLTAITKNKTILQMPTLAEMKAKLAEGQQLPSAVAEHAGKQVADKTLNNTLVAVPPVLVAAAGEIIADKSLQDHSIADPLTGRGRYATSVAKDLGARPIAGYQLRYVYFLHPGARDRLTVPVLPFSAIAEAGATMYRGDRPRTESIGGDAPDDQSG